MTERARSTRFDIQRCSGKFIKVPWQMCVYYCSTYYKAVRIMVGDLGERVLRKFYFFIVRKTESFEARGEEH